MDETSTSDIGLPADPAERLAELDRLISIGEGEMKADISAWQSDQQRRDDHRLLLEMRDEVTAAGSGGSFDLTELNQHHADVRAAIAENEKEMRTNISTWQHWSNAERRAEHAEMLEIERRMAARIASLHGVK